MALHDLEGIKLEGLPPKPAKLKRFLANHARLKRLNRMTETKQKVEEVQKSAKGAKQPVSVDGLYLLINMMQKQIDDLKSMFFSLEDQVGDLEKRKR